MAASSAILNRQFWMPNLRMGSEASELRNHSSLGSPFRLSLWVKAKLEPVMRLATARQRKANESHESSAPSSRALVKISSIVGENTKRRIQSIGCKKWWNWGTILEGLRIPSVGGAPECSWVISSAGPNWSSSWSRSRSHAWLCLSWP